MFKVGSLERHPEVIAALSLEKAKSDAAKRFGCSPEVIKLDATNAVASIFHL